MAVERCGEVQGDAVELEAAVVRCTEGEVAPRLLAQRDPGTGAPVLWLVPGESVAAHRRARLLEALERAGRPGYFHAPFATPFSWVSRCWAQLGGPRLVSATERRVFVAAALEAFGSSHPFGEAAATPGFVLEAARCLEWLGRLGLRSEAALRERLGSAAGPVERALADLLAAYRRLLGRARLADAAQAFHAVA
ncbi:MAG: hypothetical protein D6776_04990, partial [Planctomycetota bacterium]